VATIDLEAGFTEAETTEELTARVTQLVLTATAVPGVQALRIRILGGTPLGLFPGIDATRPITRKALRHPTAPPPKPPAPEPEKDPTVAVRALQQRLADLGFLPPEAVDGVAGEQTRFGVVAFQKWAGLARDGVAGPQTNARLASAERPTPRTSGSGRRVEVLLDRQLALVVDGGRVVRVITVSTGAAGTPTPAGAYAVGRKEQRSWSVPFSVWLPWASYFVGGIAFHEYPDVPPYPASHGCVRVPRYDARWLYDQTPIGTRVVVIERST
jgi:lipoprotein-anchoring transpeptidase ErfK/SrfK